MIPLPFLAGVPWRLVGAVGLVAALALAGWRVSAWKQSHEALPEVRDALKAEQACADGSKCAERVAALVERQERYTAEAVAGYEREIADLRNRPVRTRTVRLCPETDSGDVRVPGAAGGTGQGSAAAGLVPGRAGPDIGPGLYALAGRADELAAQCRAIIARDRALALPIESR